jgi:hypothetical protein
VLADEHEVIVEGRHEVRRAPGEQVQVTAGEVVAVGLASALDADLGRGDGDERLAVSEEERRQVLVEEEPDRLGSGVVAGQVRHDEGVQREAVGAGAADRLGCQLIP